MIFSKNTIKDAARLAMVRWYNKVEEAGMHSFNVIAATIYEHYDEILNFYNHRSLNAMAESFNTKIKLFRANLRGVVDKIFFLFRIAKLYRIPNNFLLSRIYCLIEVCFFKRLQPVEVCEYTLSAVFFVYFNLHF